MDDIREFVKGYVLREDKHLVDLKPRDKISHWVFRLLKNDAYQNCKKDALQTAVIFHAYGQMIRPRFKDTPEYSEIIFEEYRKRNKTADDDFIAYLLKNYSNKALMHKKDTPIELILFMEAEILTSEVQHRRRMGINEILALTTQRTKPMRKNPMITEEAKKIWEEIRNSREVRKNELR
jgi:hypothetical protein